MSLRAEEFPLPEDPYDTVIGGIGSTEVRAGQTLLDIARSFDLGHDQIIAANPSLNRWVPPVGAAVVLPARYILPPGPRSGIVLNVAELRLYYYPPSSDVVLTYPVSIGGLDWRTPLGTTRITSKEVDPAWYPPRSIRREHLAEGDELPSMIPGGAEDNPLGHYALKLGIGSYLIHGTDERRSFGIGMRVSHGCVRMYPEDIEELFYLVSNGTSVRIIDAPIKVGWRRGVLFVEAHRPVEFEELEAIPPPSLDTVYRLIEKATQPSDVIEEEQLDSVLQEASGVPHPVGRRAG